MWYYVEKKTRVFNKKVGIKRVAIIRKLEKFLSGNMNTKIHDESLSAL